MTGIEKNFYFESTTPTVFDKNEIRDAVYNAKSTGTNLKPQISKPKKARMTFSNRHFSLWYQFN